MASPRTRRVLRELKFKDGNNVSGVGLASYLANYDREILTLADDMVLLLLIHCYCCFILRLVSYVSCLSSQ